MTDNKYIVPLDGGKHSLHIRSLDDQQDYRITEEFLQCSHQTYHCKSMQFHRLRLTSILHAPVSYNRYMQKLKSAGYADCRFIELPNQQDHEASEYVQWGAMQWSSTIKRLRTLGFYSFMYSHQPLILMASGSVHDGKQSNDFSTTLNLYYPKIIIDFYEPKSWIFTKKAINENPALTRRKSQRETLTNKTWNPVSYLTFYILLLVEMDAGSCTNPSLTESIHQTEIRQQTQSYANI